MYIHIYIYKDILPDSIVLEPKLRLLQMMMIRENFACPGGILSIIVAQNHNWFISQISATYLLFGQGKKKKYEEVWVKAD